MTLVKNNNFVSNQNFITSTSKPKIALIRMDRMGDLLCTLPVDQGQYPFDFHWVISKNLGFIIDNGAETRKYTEFELAKKSSNIKKFIDFLAEEKFDGAIVFHAPAWVSWALWKAKIPLRFGPRSQWHQMIFLNHTLRQYRNKSIHHEADYNFELFKWAIDIATKKTKERFNENFNVSFPKNTPYYRFQKLEIANAPVSSLLNKPYIVIHPGMGGSALNWSQEKYIEIIKICLENNYIVVITGTESDSRWLTDISNYCTNKPNVVWLVGELSGTDLITVLQKAIGVIAPSTGVIHLAAACQVPSLGLYSPLRVQSSTRWAPRSEIASALSPAIKCPSPLSCIKNKCNNYPCLDLIHPSEVFNKLQSLI